MRKRITIITISIAFLSFIGVGWAYHQSQGNTVEASKTEKDQNNILQKTLPVITTLAAERLFEDALSLQGNVTAKNYAEVPALVSGVLDAVYLEEGERVVKDETLLFQVDQDNLKRAVRIAEQEFSVAQYSVSESEAMLESTQASLDKAELDYQRFQRLFKKNAATQEALEQQESRYKQLSAQQKHGQALVDLRKEQLIQCKIAVEMSEKNLQDSVVRAPIDGIVTQRLREPGEMAEPGKAVLKIEDMSILEVSAFLPVQFYALVIQNETEMQVQVSGMDLGSFPVIYKAPTIDAKLRAFEVRCILEEPAAVVAPGAIAEITVPFERYEALGVPRDAVQIRNGQTVVFVVEQDQARMVSVQTGIVSDGWIEVSDSELTANMAVVSAGQYMLNDASPVIVQREDS